MNCFYILDADHNPVRIDFLNWTEWMSTADRRVARTVIEADLGDGPEELVVSTVFLGINHAMPGDPTPELFETMVIDRHYRDLELQRYATWKEAVEGHEEMVSRWLSQYKGRLK